MTTEEAKKILQYQINMKDTDVNIIPNYEAIELILKDNTRLDKENQKLFEQSLFQDKVIDLICKDYVETNEVLDQYFPPVDEKLLDKEQMKQYFYKKVEETD